MDIDRYIARNEPTWIRLAVVTRRANHGISGLTTDEVEELVQLYQRTSSHLSFVRTNFREPALTARLTRLVASANSIIYGKRARTWRAVTRFFALTYPGAAYHFRRFILLAAVLFFGPAIVLGAWLTNDPATLDRSASLKVRQEYVHEKFEPYYSNQPAPQFFAEVTVNNIVVSFEVFAFGAVTGGLGAVYLLVTNSALLGVVSAWMISEGDFGRFLGFIIPHGALELSAIVIAGGAGLAVGWSYIAPGDRLRSDAFRDAAQRLVTIIIGLMTMFLGAGLIEGFITGSGLPVWLRIGIGALLWIAYVGYLVTQGRIAASQGITGRLSEHAAPWKDDPGLVVPASARIEVPGRLA